MPIVKLPFSKGLKTDAEADYIDALPVNMIPVPKPVIEAAGYMRSWPGLESVAVASGPSRGAFYNVVTQTQFRVNGSSLQEFDCSTTPPTVTTRALSEGSGLVSITGSVNTTAWADNDKLYYWDGSVRTEIQNWTEGEKFSTNPDWQWTPNFGVGAYITIPEFSAEPQDTITIQVDLEIDDVNSVQWLLAGESMGNPTVGVFIDSGALFFADLAGDTTEIAQVSLGKNNIFFTVRPNDAWAVDTIGARPDAGSYVEEYTGQMLDLRITVEGGETNRIYPLLLTTDPDSDAPTTTQIEDTESGATGSLTGDWERVIGAPEPTLSPPTEFDLDNIIDVVRNAQRYCFIQRGKGTFGVTDIENEQRIDYIAPFYGGSSNPDVAIAIKEWRQQVVLFSRYSVEFYGLTGSATEIYRQNQPLTVRAGILGRGCVCPFLDSFAILGGGEGEAPSIYVISNGGYKQGEIATRRIQKILSGYSLEELATVYMEPRKWDNHDGILVHLPDTTLWYDGATGQTNRWAQLESDGNYIGIHHIYDDTCGEWIAGDKESSNLYESRDDIASHNGEAVSFKLFTPLVRGRNRVAYDFNVESVTGVSPLVESLFLSSTKDGINYQSDVSVIKSEPGNFTDYNMIRNLGRIQNRMGWRVTWSTTEPTSISDFQIRIE